MEKLLVIIVGAILVGCFIGLIYQLAWVLPRMGKRNNDVYDFRIFVLIYYPDLFEQLPSYEEMMVDGKKLKLESYIKDFKKIKKNEKNK